MTTWICKNCETENDADAVVCSTCGAKRDAQPADSSDRGVSSYGNGHIHTNGPQGQAISSQYRNSHAPSENSAESNDDLLRLRELIKKYDGQKSTFKTLAILSVIFQLILYAVPYVKGYADFTIYKNCTGINGAIEQICSILLVCITIAPAVVVCINLNVRKRNLPITIAVIVAILTTIYSGVIWFGNGDSTGVPALIILSTWACVVFAVRLVKTLNELDNAMYRPSGF